MTALGVVLLTQAFLAAAVGAARLGTPLGAPGLERLSPAVSQLDGYSATGLLLLSPFFLVAAVGFFRLWRRAWLIGMSLQGIGLLVSLILYLYSNVTTGPVYAAMAYHVLTVLYLNSRAVRTIFKVRSEDEI